MKIPEFDTIKQRLEFLVKNQNKIIAAKRAKMKQADAFTFGAFAVRDGVQVEKANTPIPEDEEFITVRAVINTTNLMDSYDDVHIPGLWTKTLKENKDIYHDQEHKSTFESTISDYKDLKAYVQTMTWKELGQKWEGTTQAFIFESIVREERNEFMFEQYKKGYVRNHSVGMQYVKIALAVNDKDYKTEYSVWQKYIDTIANKDEVEAQGYFFAVTEAKAIEGSAVKRGANWVTPTLDNNLSEPPEGTHKAEPEQSTLTQEQIIQRIKNY